MVTAIKIDLESIAESVFVCSDSNYNQPATSFKRYFKKAAAPTARLIDDECSSLPIIF